MTLESGIDFFDITPSSLVPFGPVTLVRDELYCDIDSDCIKFRDQFFSPNRPGFKLNVHDAKELLGSVAEDIYSGESVFIPGPLDTTGDGWICHSYSSMNKNRGTNTVANNLGLTKSGAALDIMCGFLHKHRPRYSHKEQAMAPAAPLMCLSAAW